VRTPTRQSPRARWAYKSGPGATGRGCGRCCSNILADDQPAEGGWRPAFARLLQGKSRNATRWGGMGVMVEPASYVVSRQTTASVLFSSPGGLRIPHADRDLRRLSPAWIALAARAGAGIARCRPEGGGSEAELSLRAAREDWLICERGGRAAVHIATVRADPRARRARFTTARPLTRGYGGVLQTFQRRAGTPATVATWRRRATPCAAVASSESFRFVDDHRPDDPRTSRRAAV